MGLNKEDAVKKIESTEGEVEFEVRTSDEHKTYLDNYAKAEVENRIGAEISKVHSQYDADIESILGVRKAGDQKTYDFLKEQLTSLKAATGQTDRFKTKVSELEEALKNKSGDEQLKKDYNSLKELYNEDKAKWDTKTQEFITSQELMKIEIQLDNAAQRLKFKEEIPATVREVMIKNAVDKLVKQGKIAENQLIFTDSEGKTALNKENNLNPYTADEMLTRELKDIIGESKTITKPQTKPEIKEVDGKKVVPISLPDSVRFKEDLSGYLMSLGLDRNSEEYKIAYAEYSDKLPHK